MKKCLIIAPLFDGCDEVLKTIAEDDLVLCADAGYRAACRYGIKPDLVIGDFDSMPVSEMDGEMLRITLPVKKDDTDLTVCIREAWERGYRSFVIAGALGGRMDHTIAALQTAKDAVLRGGEVVLISRNNRIKVCAPGMYLHDRTGWEGSFLSVLAATDVVRGVTLTGTEWELHQAELTASCPLGVSNQATGNVRLSFEEGLIYLIDARDGK